jgi:hypothetical protein
MKGKYLVRLADYGITNLICHIDRDCYDFEARFSLNRDKIDVAEDIEGRLIETETLWEEQPVLLAIYRWHQNSPQYQDVFS